MNQIPVYQTIIFAPDRNLVRYISQQTGRDLVLCPGSGIAHETFSERKIIELKVAHPEAKIIVHLECESSVLRHADYIVSTTALLNYSLKSSEKPFIVATEMAIIHQMQKSAPEKLFIPAPALNNCACNECPYMRLNTLEKLYLCMRDKTPEITIFEDLRVKALLPIQRMLEMS